MKSSSPATQKTNQNSLLRKSLLSTLAWLRACACILWTELKQSDLTEAGKLVSVHICIRLETPGSERRVTLWNEYACQRLIPPIVQCASSFSICCFCSTVTCSMCICVHTLREADCEVRSGRSRYIQQIDYTESSALPKFCCCLIGIFGNNKSCPNIVLSRAHKNRTTQNFVLIPHSNNVIQMMLVFGLVVGRPLLRRGTAHSMKHMV